MLAFDADEVNPAIAAGDQAALLHALAATAAFWLHLGGCDVAHRKSLFAVNCAVEPSPDRRAILSAGCDLYDLLASSPQGRQALLDLRREPILQKTESE